MRQPSTKTHRARTHGKPVKSTATVPFMAPVKSGTPNQAPSPQPAKTAGPALPATVKYEIDWNAITPQVVHHVRRRLKAKPQLPHGWDEKKIVSFLTLRVSGLLIQQNGGQGLAIPAVVREQTNQLFTAFPDMRAQDDRWAVSRAKTLTAHHR